MIRTGLDRLVDDPAPLAGRPFGLLAHHASVTADLVPAHLALAACGARPAVLFGPEHGYYGVEQDMVASADAADPWTGAEIRSLYGETEASLRPSPEAFAALELLVVDLQDVGSRYYTYAATAVWAAEAALEAGCEVLVLDRPNPLGGAVVEGSGRRPGYESFVGAFDTPVRHGLTLGELVTMMVDHPAADGEAVEVLTVEGWRREATWPEIGRPWIAPSPNMPTYEAAALYPGLCLVEGTVASEGRGTTRPFRLVGAPGLDPRELHAALAAAGLPGVGAVPCYFRPQFQKHAGALCGGVELSVLDSGALPALRLGVALVAALHELAGGDDVWRTEAYEFVDDRPAIDLLAGSAELRTRLSGGEPLDPWIDSWAADEAEFTDRREEVLLYP